MLFYANYSTFSPNSCGRGGDAADVISQNLIHLSRFIIAHIISSFILL